MIPSKLIPVQENRLRSLIFCHWIHPSAFMIAASSALFRSCKACRTSMKWWSNRWATQFLDPITPIIWVIICRYTYIHILYIYILLYIQLPWALLGAWMCCCLFGVFLFPSVFLYFWWWGGVGWGGMLTFMFMLCWRCYVYHEVGWGGMLTFMFMLRWNCSLVEVVFETRKNRRARLHAQLHGEVHANILKTTRHLSVPFPFS